MAMFNYQGMCCSCLKASVSLTDLFTTDQNGITLYDKIASSLTRIANVVEFNANFSLCEVCSNMVNIVYKFNQNCLQSITSYKNILHANLNQQQCNDSARLETTESINSIEAVTIKVERGISPHLMDTANSYMTNESVATNKFQTEEDIIIKEELESPLEEEDTNQDGEGGKNFMEYDEAGPSSTGTAASLPMNETNSDLTSNIDVKPKKVRCHIIWEKESVFQDESELMNFITSENCWSKLTKFNDCHENIVVRYRCNKVKLRGKQCAAALRVVYSSTNNDIYLYRSTSSHTHSNIPSKQMKISEEVRQEIKNIYNWDETIKPARILHKLSEKKLPLPTKVQLTNYLSALRKQKQDKSIEHLEELQQIIIEKSVVPLGGI